MYQFSQGDVSQFKTSKQSAADSLGAKEIPSFCGLPYTNLKTVANELCGIQSFLFTVGLVVGIDERGYGRRYCYETAEEAINALQSWDGTQTHPPGGWIKCKGVMPNGQAVDLLNPQIALF